MDVNHKVDRFPKGMRLSAPPLELNIEQGRVWLDGEAVRLSNRPFQLLVALMSRPEKLWSKDELIEEVWDGLAVSDSVLATAMKELRRAINDPARQPRFIETAHGRGYRFLPPVEQIPHDKGKSLREDGEPGAALETKSANSPQAQQTVRFCKASDGTSLAWSRVGVENNAAPLVKAANWLTHLERDWEAPIWSPLFRALAQKRPLVRYDERGCGLSDWNVAEISFETFVTDLEAVVDAAGIDRFPLLGISQGASVSIEYAARHPERVSHLILFGGYAAGWRHTATPEQAQEREAVMVLTQAGWGRDDPAYRHIFSSTFMPSATAAELSWFDEFQRQTTSPQNAVRFLHAFADIDVRERLSSINVPTLVLHSNGDHRIPVKTGTELAAAIPNAQFVGLDSDNHLLLGREPASKAFIETIDRFLSS